MPFTQATARKHATKAHESRRVSSCGIISEMQARLMQDVLSDETKPAERAQLMRAYVDGEKLKRIIKGQAANTSQSIRSEPVKKSRTQSTGPIESVQEEAKPSGDQASEASGK